MDIHAPILWQAIILTVTCNILEFLALFFYAVAASRFARLFTGPRFSWWMTSMLHRFPDRSPFEQRLQLAELDYVSSSTAASTAIAESFATA